MKIDCDLVSKTLHIQDLPINTEGMTDSEIKEFSVLVVQIYKQFNLVLGLSLIAGGTIDLLNLTKQLIEKYCELIEGMNETLEEAKKVINGNN